jgi:hypothetical protein
MQSKFGGKSLFKKKTKLNWPLMRCYKINTCAFFSHYRDRFGEKAFKELVGSFCEGPLQPLCRRLAYMAVRGEEPPLDLCPDGYKAGTGIKIDI